MVLCLDLSILAGSPKKDGLSDSGRVEINPVNSCKSNGYITQKVLTQKIHAHWFEADVQKNCVFNII